MEMTLSTEEKKKIKADNTGTHMLTDEQILGIVDKVNKKINIPVIGEDLERTVFYKMVKLIDMKLYEVLPNEYYELINNLESGISDEEAKLMVKRLSKVLNRHINIPIIGEKMEGKLIRRVLKIIVGAMRENVKL
ncbi:MAG: hypothetical protein N4A46_14495 [Schleiferiaceae bacterium]|jgi:hypothetical protein|nr:hypothetical protein [Schleiferiaceae bacterium]